MTLEELGEISEDISCQVGQTVWWVHCGLMGDDGFYVQLRYLEPDIVTLEVEEQHARKWIVSRHACKSEVVQTVLKACLTSAEHMIREHFKYRGVAIFGPHFDVDRLVELVTEGHIVAEARQPVTQSLTTFEALKAQKDAILATQSPDEKMLRQMLWLRHGCMGLYGDDGEMQCACLIDFKRDTVASIYHRFEELALRRAAEKPV